MPAASPSPDSKMNMPMPGASPSPNAMGQMEETHMMDAMDMGPLVVMSGDDMGIRVGSSDANLTNPRQQQTTEMIAEADEHFVEHCSLCHAIDGRGDTNGTAETLNHKRHS